MRSLKLTNHNHAQTAIEYLLILAVVAAIVLASQKVLLPKVQNSAEGYYNNVTDVILSRNVQAISGGWCPVECPPVSGNPQACGNPIRYRTCECPAPAFGGAYCPNDSLVKGNMVCQGDRCQCTGLKSCDNTCTDQSCSALTPACDQVTFGSNNCNPPQSCFRVGPPCPTCIPDPNQCNAPTPACGQTTTGTGNCGPCTKTGPSCCVPNQPDDTCGTDNCGNSYDKCVSPKTCQSGQCLLPASCNTWGNWSSCPATICGQSGTQTRSCTICGPGGCPADETQPCSGNTCPAGQSCVNGLCCTAVDGTCNSWGDCSAAACGTSGTQTCTSSTPSQCGGNPAPTSQDCTGTACPAGQTCTSGTCVVTNCPATTVNVSCVGAVNIPAGNEHNSFGINCPLSCYANGVSAQFDCVQGAWTLIRDCASNNCPTTLTNNGCTVTFPTNNGNQTGTCSGTGCSGTVTGNCSGTSWSVTGACAQCGDGIKNGTEACDGGDLGGQICQTQGFAGGTLKCNSTCDGYDTSGCTMCGNNQIDAGEVCDGTAVNGQTCASQGFGAGTLKCNSSCSGYDTSDCGPVACGDGVCTKPTETCLNCAQDCGAPINQTATISSFGPAPCGTDINGFNTVYAYGPNTANKVCQDLGYDSATSYTAGNRTVLTKCFWNSTTQQWQFGGESSSFNPLGSVTCSKRVCS